jgi:hypothetical protein
VEPIYVACANRNKQSGFVDDERFSHRCMQHVNLIGKPCGFWAVEGVWNIGASGILYAFCALVVAVGKLMV